MSTSFADTIAAALEQSAGNDDFTLETLPEETGAADTSVDGESSGVDDAEEEDESSEETVTADAVEVEVNGETVAVSLDELKKGYLRQSDYTRKMQALKKDAPEDWESERAHLSERAQVSEIIDQRFAQDPEALIGDFFLQSGSSKEEITARLMEVTKYLIGHDAVTDDLLQIYSLTPTHKKAYAKSVQERRARNERELELAQKEQKYAPVAQKEEEDKYIQEADSILSGVLDSKGVSQDEFAEVRLATYEYMAKNDLLEVSDVKRVAAIILKEREVAKREAALTKPKSRKSPVARPSRPGSAVPNRKAQSLEDTIAANLQRFAQ